MTRPRKDPPPDAAESQAGKVRSWRQYESAIDFVLKFAAVPGVIVYAVLFVSYRRYYSALGMDPEDAGVTNTYVLSRSLGLIFLTVLFVTLAALPPYFDENRMSKWVKAVASTFLLVPLGAFVAILLKSSNLSFIAIMLMLALFSITVTPDIYSRLGLRARIVRLAVLITVGVILLTAALSSYANSQALNRALRGCHVKPLDFHGVPILDISATVAMIDWIGPREQRPPDFSNFPAQSSVTGLVIGRGTTLAFLKQENMRMKLVQVPANLVMVQTYPGSMSDLLAPGPCPSN
jgi:hypothetical protein